MSVSSSKDSDGTSIVDVQENGMGRSSGVSASYSSKIHPDVHSGGLGQVVPFKSQRNHSNNEKLFLLKKIHFIPTKEFQFPTRTFKAQKCQSVSKELLEQVQWPNTFSVSRWWILLVFYLGNVKDL